MTMKYGTVAVLIVLTLSLSMFMIRLPATVKADPGTLTVPEEYPTITAAIAAANPGDTVMVGPGTYNEEVVIDKAVNVLGSGAGSTFINGTGVVLASAGLVKITAPGDVTFDGFTVENAPLDPNLNRFAIFSESSTPGVTYTISNNEIIGTGDTNPNDFEVGFYSQNDQANVVFSYNNITNMGGNNIVFEVHTGRTEISYNNLEAGVGLAADSVFFMTYNGNDVNALQNISYNTFNMGTGSVFDYDHRSSAISICTPGAAYGVGDAQFTNVVIQGNYIYNLQSYRRGIGFWNGGGSGGGIIGPYVEDNTVTGTGAIESYGIDFEATGSSPIAATNATVMNNTISNTADGIYLRTDGCAPGAQVYFNNIVGNTVGLNNTIGSSAVDARYDWWGDPTGPYNPTSNPSGQGNPVTDNVTYQPYQTSPVPTPFTPEVYIDPSLIQMTPADIGTTFEVNVTITGVRGLQGFDFNLTWDSTLLNLTNVDFNMELNNVWGSGNWQWAVNESGPGYYKLVALSTASSFTSTQPTSLFELTFTVDDPQSNFVRQTPIHFDTDKLSDPQANAIVHTVTDGTYSITSWTPTLQMSPSNQMCRKYGETFTVQVGVTEVFNLTGFKFEIHYNTTLLTYAAISLNAWGSGTVAADLVNGNITGTTSGQAISGNQTLITLQFTATYYHIWKDESKVSGWQNNQSGLIYIQWANVSYSSSPDLSYVRGGSTNQISVGPDFTYTFSPIEGDVNNDGTVNILDLRTVAAFYDVKQGDSMWPAASAYDLNGDSIIDIYDLVIIASNWGYQYR
jgi:hypothetical protein